MTGMIETIDKIPDAVLMHVIQRSNDFSWKFLAVKISLTRLNLKLRMSPKDDSIKSLCCEEFRNLLKKSINVPNAVADLNLLIALQKDLK